MHCLQQTLLTADNGNQCYSLANALYGRDVVDTALSAQNLEQSTCWCDSCVYDMSFRQHLCPKAQRHEIGGRNQPRDDCQNELISSNKMLDTTTLYHPLEPLPYVFSTYEEADGLCCPVCKTARYSVRNTNSMILPKD